MCVSVTLDGAIYTSDISQGPGTEGIAVAGCRGIVVIKSGGIFEQGMIFGMCGNDLSHHTL